MTGGYGDDIEATIKTTMAMVLGIRPETIEPDTSPDTVEAWDSIQHVNLILALQEALGVQFEPGEIMDMLSYGAILRYVGKRGS